ncbi:caspase domain-containing protein [Streptomyces sp. NPDC002888]|uniref:caspase family protein n=1 Tax=Streptomyces sp. NPDC002888 TaxID=3364668 RepID=UPI00368541FD
MAELSDPVRSEAVLVGVHEYSVLENLPAVARNLDGLRQALTDPAVWGLPFGSCTVLPQPQSGQEVLDVVLESARRAQDTLIVYYAGHGLTDPHSDELCLALPGSDPERSYTSLRYEYLRQAVLDPMRRAQRIVVILDCCYSGRALLGRMSASDHIADQAAVDGTCVLTASAETRPALSPPGEWYTAFTGELITALTEGVPGRPDPLDMDTLYRHLHRQLASKSRPLPQQRNRNSGGLIAIARNRAMAGAAEVEREDVPARQLEVEKRISDLEEKAEGLRQETERIRIEAELRALATVAVAHMLARAIAAPPEPDFAPFWFAVPVKRPLMGEHGSLTPVGELVTGIWHLAVGQRGDALVVKTQDGVGGLLLDTSGIERGSVVEDAQAAVSAGQGIGSVRRRDEARERVQEALLGAQQVAHALAAQPNPYFLMFWFAVPEPRLLFSEDGTMTAVTELVPGIWYLAVEQRGDALVAQTQDGRRGILVDAAGIQRG